MHLQLRYAAIASWRKERKHIPPTTAAVACQGRAAEEKATGKLQKNLERVFSSNFIKPQLSFAAALRGKANQVH
jgi:hypothetical protein